MMSSQEHRRREVVIRVTDMPGEEVISLSRKVLSLLTGGAIK